MADTDNTTPISDGDIIPPPATTTFEPAEPLKNAGVGFDAEGDTLRGAHDRLGEKTGDASLNLKDGASRLGQQAGDKARYFAEEGKARAGGALDQLSQMLNDAAGQVDEKLGAQYGEYARSAAGAVSGFSEQVKAKDIDALVEDARGLVRKSPAVAIGAAAAVGFVLARLISSGLDQRDA